MIKCPSCDANMKAKSFKSKIGVKLICDHCMYRFRANPDGTVEFYPWTNGDDPKELKCRMNAIKRWKLHLNISHGNDSKKPGEYCKTYKMPEFGQ